MRPECIHCPVLKSALFRALSSDQVSRLVCVFRPTRYRKSQILFFEGGTAQHLFALHSGLVKMVKPLENGKERITRVLFPGELFGLEALTEAEYPLTAVTLRDSEICAAARDDFVEFLRANTDIALGMIRFLVSEVARVRRQVTDMSFKDPRMKVATLLLSLTSFDAAESNGAPSLTLPFSRQEISEILELSPETVSRTFSAFRRANLIEACGRRVVVRDRQGLQTAARR